MLCWRIVSYTIIKSTCYRRATLPLNGVFKAVSQNLPELHCPVTLKQTYQTGLTQLIPLRPTGSTQSGFRRATAYTDLIDKSEPMADLDKFVKAHKY